MSQKSAGKKGTAGSRQARKAAAAQAADDARVSRSTDEPRGNLRGYYLFAALPLFVGDVAAIATEQALAVIIFTVLTFMMLWIAWRVDRSAKRGKRTEAPTGASSRDRPY